MTIVVGKQTINEILEPSDVERFWKRVVKSDDGCWLYTGFLNEKGYGIFGFDYSVRKAHRVAYELIKGTIPDGSELHHLCHNRSCVNPDHLRAISHTENCQDGVWRAKTHCPQGHPYDLFNTKFYQGRRYCRACNREIHRRKASN